MIRFWIKEYSRIRKSNYYYVNVFDTYEEAENYIENNPNRILRIQENEDDEENL